MASDSQREETRWDRVFQKLDSLEQRMLTMDGVQQQLMAQADLAAGVAQEAARERLLMSRQIEETGKVVAQMRLERLAAQLDSDQGSQGDHHPHHRRMHHQDASFTPRTESLHLSNSPRRPQRPRRGRTGLRHDPPPPSLPKMQFPEFVGRDPVVWIDHCLTYFSIYRIPQDIWVVSASLHMKENAARWYQVHKIKHGIESWEGFTESVMNKFGAESYPQAMRQLLGLRQQHSLLEYTKEFEEVRYRVAIHNSEIDEVFFVEQYIRGLKFELQGLVQTALPSSVNRAMILAELHQTNLDKARARGTKGFFQSKPSASTARPDAIPVNLPSDLSKERQVREYRRLHGLCYACGERFEPGHLAKCAKRNAAQLHVLSTEDLSMELSDSVLEQLQKEDEAQDYLCHLSLNVISRHDSSGSIKIRATLNNMIILILVDSGSSTCFINLAVVTKAG
jgi:hypothetical protein